MGIGATASLRVAGSGGEEAAGDYTRSMAFPIDAAQARANLEIKARCGDLAGARRRAERLATRRLGVEHQVDR